MEDPTALYAKIQELVKNEARQIATEVYNTLGTQFGVAKVPTASYDGVDANRIQYKNIIQGDKYASDISEDTTEVVTLGGISNPTRIVFQGFAANNSITAYTLTGSLALAAVNATLSTNWTRTSGIYPVTFSNGDVRYVTFTNASTAISWTGGLSSTATASITVGANKRAIINGEINFGSCFLFTDLTPPITVSTNGPGIPFIQSSNAMYVDSNDLTKNRVFTNPLSFIYSLDDTGTVFASAQATSYNNQLGLLTISFVVGANVKIQGALTIT